mmetsp:Transcript_35598/g.83222  ORF Transcript_35598/g.83222 Transcript_35598/m.83222 type:complete len:480 (-) Transcript_35598:172-1611(-)|eukprot:CAMPEP_0178436288 /NCGR_PEP_ID=MMETSP0689_2-20121128/34363_1 /TAXON_ID=160604 /ORGANISM="Amphidinium massartii, Strain CS-259" /LENGTH=479 /DNA_ID=CAMNT_0020058381 /DNA_START=58 /DNA_END=1497 /DNA_ORIENTATION=+
MIEYTESWLVLLLFRLQGSVGLRATTFALPCALLSLLLVYVDENYPGFLEDRGVDILTNSQLWTAATTVLGILLIFRTNRAMNRFWEGTGLLHQMRGEWFDSVSCCVTFTRGALATKPKDVMEFRHTIVRLMSLCHASALEEIAGETEELETIDTYGLNSTTLMHLKDCKDIHKFNMVEVLLHLIQTLITQGLEDGTLKIPPPILSRVYQTLSRGFVNLLNAKKIADTRFPFPFAQLISMMLFLNIFLMPFLIVCLTRSKFWAPIFSFVPIFGFASLNFIGVELENPFGDDANDLPLEHFQTEMNKCLLMLLQENADLIPGTSNLRCRYDFAELKASMDQMEEKRRSRTSTKGLKLATDSLKLTVHMNPGCSGVLQQYLPLDNKKHNRLSIAEAYARAEKEALAQEKESALNRLIPQPEIEEDSENIEEHVEAAVETAMDVIHVVEESPTRSRLQMATVGSYSVSQSATEDNIISRTDL